MDEHNAECASLRAELEAATLAAGDALLYEELTELIIRVSDYLMKAHETLRRKVRMAMRCEIARMAREFTSVGERCRKFLAAVLALALVIACCVPGGLALPRRAHAVAPLASGAFSTGLSWQLDAQMTLTVSGAGAVPDNAKTELDFLSDTSMQQAGVTIKRIVIGEGVTSIGPGAFSQLRTLQSVELPSTLESIGDAAFCWCDPTLKTVNLSPCTRLKSIGESAFSWCSGLGRVDIPASVITIDAGAFAHCHGLSTLTIASGSQLRSIGERAFAATNLSDLTIPASVETIGAQAFRTAVSSYYEGVVFEEGSRLTAIPDEAFYGCVMKSICIPASITSIGTGALAQNFRLEELSFERGSRLESIDWSMLNTCENLKSLEVPASITQADTWLVTIASRLERCYVGSKQLYDSLIDELQGTNVRVLGLLVDEETGLRYLENGDCVTVLGYEGSSDTLVVPDQIDGRPVTELAAHAFEQAEGLREIVLPACVEAIGANAFSGAGNLERVYVATGAQYQLAVQSGLDASHIESVTVDEQSGLRYLKDEDSVGITGYVGDQEELVIPATIEGLPVTSLLGTFAGNERITQVSLPATIAELPARAFEGCTALERIVIPAGVSSICARAFAGCASLREVVFEQESTCATIGAEAFAACAKLGTLEVPASVERVGDNAFASCGALASVTFAEGARLADIGEFAFRACGSLEHVELPSTLASVGTGAFYGCASLMRATFAAGSSLRTLGTMAFWGCAALAAIELPASLQSIGDGAFGACASLASVTLLHDGATSLGARCFSDMKDPGVIYVTSQEDYEALTQGKGNLAPGHVGVVRLGSGRISISEASVSVADGSAYLSGLPVTPQVSVALAGETLQEGRDYVLGFGNNAKAGRATVSVTGIGAYTGFAVASFTIAKAAVPVPVARGGLVYDGGVYYGVPESELYELSGQIAARETGTYVAVATLTDPDNYAWDTGSSAPAEVTWSIVAAADGGSSASDADGITEASASGAVPQSPANAATQKEQSDSPQVGDEFEVGAAGLSYRVVKVGANASVSFVGAPARAKSIVIPKAIKHGGVKYKVISVAARALKGHKRLVKLTIGANVRSIGKKAFAKCLKLKRITVKSRVLTAGSVGVGAFSGVSKTAKVTVPKALLKRYRTVFVKRGLPKKSQVTS